MSDLGYITAPHFSRLLRHAWGYGGHILDLNPRAPTGEHPYVIELRITSFCNFSNF